MIPGSFLLGERFSSLNLPQPGERVAYTCGWDSDDVIGLCTVQWAGYSLAYKEVIAEIVLDGEVIFSRPRVSSLRRVIQ